jgi:hypothetical protein
MLYRLTAEGSRENSTVLVRSIHVWRFLVDEQPSASQAGLRSMELTFKGTLLKQNFKK